MDNDKVEPVVLPDVYDPKAPTTDLIAPRPADNPADEQPKPSPDTGKTQPQKQPQTEPLNPDKDTDIGGGD
jgi:hypothetical protein